MRASIVAVLCTLFWVGDVRAERRQSFADPVIASRAELVVVGNIEEFVTVRHPRTQAGASSAEYHAKLRIHAVLKGKAEETELSIVIHFGLQPNMSGPDGRAITVMDTVYGTTVLSEAGSPNLWFFRKRSTIFQDPGRPTGAPGSTGLDHYGIIDPEDLQPLELKEYFLVLLSENPEAGLKKLITKDPGIAERARRSLTYYEVQRILKNPDAYERAEKLMPYYVDYCRGKVRLNDLRKFVVSCGPAAGPHLLKLVKNREPADSVRRDAIGLLGEIRFTGAVDTLCNILLEHENFWAKQKLTPGWWQSKDEPKLAKRRQDAYWETSSLVYVLGQIGDPRAKEAILRTRQRWLGTRVEDQQVPSRVLENCEFALQKLDTPK